METTNEPECVVCGLQKYGPGNGFCFDCHNHAVHVLKQVNRKIISKAEGMKKITEGKDGSLLPL
jgi:hypothetical protein